MLTTCLSEWRAGHVVGGCARPRMLPGPPCGAEWATCPYMQLGCPLLVVTPALAMSLT